MITSTQNETIKDILKLKQKKHRDEKGFFLVEGYHLVEEARKHGCVRCIITTRDDKYDEETLYVSSHVMEKIAFTKTPQPIMAICNRNITNQINLNGKRYLLLDRVQDPGNVGTIIRTALAFGYDQVIMSNDCVDLYNDKVVRSTQGALFQMDICVIDLIDAIEVLKQRNVHIYGTSLKNAISIEDCKQFDKMAFVMGNEGQGVSDIILSFCETSAYIPIQSIESLNVGIASAIIMYHFNKE